MADQEQVPLSAEEIAVLYDATNGDARRILCRLLDERTRLQATNAQLLSWNEEWARWAARPVVSGGNPFSICTLCGDHYLKENGHQCFHDR